MARDSNGNYTLPPGNPVAANTLIEVAWANPTMSDIAVALTDSLSRTGQGGMQVSFKNADGTIAAPGMTWINEPTSGWYRKSANTFWYSVLGADVFGIDAAGVYLGVGKSGFPPDARWLLYSTRGSMLAGTAVSPGSPVELLLGADGNVLTADSSLQAGVKWAPAGTVTVDQARTWTTPQRDANTAANTGSFNMSLQNDFTCTPTGAVVLTFTNITLGQRGMISFSNTTNFAVTFAVAVKKGSTAGVDLSLTGLRDIAYWSPDGVNVHITYSDLLT